MLSPLRTLNKFLLAGFTLTFLILAGCGIYVYATPKPALLSDIPFSKIYFDRHGKLLRLTLATDDKFRLQTKFSDMNSDILTATLIQEDRHFYDHIGVNPLSIVRAAYQTYIKRSRPIGASTITMQVVRLHDGIDTRGAGGKLVQILRALRLEHYYSKQQILEAYLNLAPYGGNIHGIGAASLIYFGQSPVNLALPQSLGLAVIPQNPIKRFPLNTDGAAWAAARKRLFDQLPPSYKSEASQLELPLTVETRDDLPFLAPHYINGLPASDKHFVTTTLDLPMQIALQKAMTSWLEQKKVQGLDNAAIMLIDAPTMEVRALIGSGNFFDKATSGQVDGTSAPRSPGSTLKPFVYALALEQGLIHPETLLEDAPAFFAEYRPGNFDNRFVGELPAHEALALSRNIPAIMLASKLKKPTLYEFLQNAGAGLPKDSSHYGLSMVIGGAETDMRTLTKLYAMLANGGMLQDLKYTIDQPGTSSRQILSPEASLLTLTMLERPDPDLPPFASSANKLPVYWKTGTSSSFRDAWTIGIVGPYVLTVWTGHFDGRPSPALIGTEAAAPLFFNLVNLIEERENLEDHVHPAMKNLNVTRVASGTNREGWFIPGKSPFAATGHKTPKPEILTPRSEIAYVTHKESAEPLRIPLEARTTAAQRPIYWFADNRLIGIAQGTSPLFWTPAPGRYTIRSVDSQGQSASRTVNIIAE